MYQTSDQAGHYNCIAWAAGDRYNWWEPDRPKCFWPDVRPYGASIQSLVAVFEWLGYKRCRSGCLERGYEKVALYECNGDWSHAARQRRSGAWASKLGPYEDVHHARPECLCGFNEGAYGSLHCFMKRRKVRGSRFRAPASALGPPYLRLHGAPQPRGPLP